MPEPAIDSQPPLLKEDYEMLAAFRYALRQFLRFSEEAAADAGLSPQQHQALLAVKGFPGPGLATMGDLAERLQTRHHSVVGLVDRLAHNGLLIRRHAPEDGRKVFVELAPKGMAVLETLSAAHHDELRRMAPNFLELLQSLASATPDGMVN